MSSDGRPRSDVLVDIDRVTRTYRGPTGAPLRAVDGVSLKVLRGETFGLVGESGCGKSTLSRLILGLERPDSGTVTFDGHVISAESTRRLRTIRPRMQMVFQDPQVSLNRRKTVEQIVGLPLTVHGSMNRLERSKRVGELLEMVGLRPELATRYPHQMSGGQCQRVGIARAIALGPELVVLDEAVSAVDVSIQAQIVNLLKGLQQRLGLTFVFVSHDLAVVRYMSDRIAVMQQGKVVELADRDALFFAPQHEYTRSLLRAIPEPDPSRRHREG